MKSKKVRSLRIITISLPYEMGEDIVEDAEKEHRTVSEFMRELYRQYKARQIFREVSKKGKALAKKHGLKPEDLGMPSEEI